MIENVSHKKNATKQNYQKISVEAENRALVLSIPQNHPQSM